MTSPSEEWIARTELGVAFRQAVAGRGRLQRGRARVRGQRRLERVLPVVAVVAARRTVLLRAAAGLRRVRRALL